MGGEIKLIYLQKMGERWEFKTEPHERFDAFLEGLLTHTLYEMRKIHLTHGSGLYRLSYYYEISDEGMWFLRPHFANWQEMEARHYQFSEHSTLCSDCHKQSFVMLQCSCCSQWFCGGCFEKHQAKSRCHFCQNVCDSLRRCSSCGKQYCPKCESSHTFEHVFGAAGLHIKCESSSYEHIRQTYAGFGRQSTTGTPSMLPHAVREACTLLGLAANTKPTLEDIRGAFRAKVRAAADGRGGYTTDMDKLTKAKEQLVAYVKR